MLLVSGLTARLGGRVSYDAVVVSDDAAVEVAEVVRDVSGQIVEQAKKPASEAVLDMHAVHKLRGVLSEIEDSDQVYAC